MGVPLICSAFIIKHPDILRAVSSHGDSAHYLFHDDAEEIDLGILSTMVGEMTLKLWFAWRIWVILVGLPWLKITWI